MSHSGATFLKVHLETKRSFPYVQLFTNETSTRVAHKQSRRNSSVKRQMECKQSESRPRLRDGCVIAARARGPLDKEYTENPAQSIMTRTSSSSSSSSGSRDLTSGDRASLLPMPLSNCSGSSVMVAI